MGILDSRATRKNLGSVFTPDKISEFLVNWAIQSKDDIAVDPGTGHGQFLVSAFNRLIDLGARPAEAARQLHAIESHDEHFKAPAIKGRLANREGSREPINVNYC